MDRPKVPKSLLTLQPDPAQTQDAISHLIQENKSYLIYWYDPVTQKLYQFTYQLQSEDQTIRDLIYNATLNFKQQLKKADIQLKIKNLDEGLSLHIAKKSGKPNQDFPSYDFRANLYQTKQSEFSLQIHEKLILRNQSQENQQDASLSPGRKRTVEFKTKQSYNNSLNKNPKPIKNDQMDNQGFCFCFSK